MSQNGQGVPLSTIPESYEEVMRSLPEARKHADDLLVYDNTENGRGHRLVVRFIAGEMVKTTQSPGRRETKREIRSRAVVGNDRSQSPPVFDVGLPWQGSVYVRLFKVLTVNLDFAFVLACCCEIIGELHSQPSFRRATEGLR
jgi:hypothetical protein